MLTSAGDCHVSVSSISISISISIYGQDTIMRCLIASALLPLLCLAAPLSAQGVNQSDGDYLQQRATSLSDRIDGAVTRHELSRRAGAKLRLSVRRVQTLAGNLQTRKGTIGKEDADRMNQQLTAVERTLTHQPD